MDLFEASNKTNLNQWSIPADIRPVPEDAVHKQETVP